LNQKTKPYILSIVQWFICGVLLSACRVDTSAHLARKSAGQLYPGTTFERANASTAHRQALGILVPATSVDCTGSTETCRVQGLFVGHYIYNLIHHVTSSYYAPQLTNFLMHVPFCQGDELWNFVSTLSLNAKSGTAFLLDKAELASLPYLDGAKIQADTRAWMLTAGHTVTSSEEQAKPNRWRVIFDLDTELISDSHTCGPDNRRALQEYFDENDPDVQPGPPRGTFDVRVPKSRVYDVDEVFGPWMGPDIDVAMIALKQPVGDRKALPLWHGTQEQERTLVGQPATVLAFPYGAFLHASRGGSVQAILPHLLFNLAVFSASSGAPVILSESKEGTVAGVTAFGHASLCLEVSHALGTGCHLFGESNIPNSEELTIDIQLAYPAYPNGKATNVCWRLFNNGQDEIHSKSIVLPRISSPMLERISQLGGTPWAGGTSASRILGQLQVLWPAPYEPSIAGSQ